PEIIANDAQRDEWVRLFAIDEIVGDTVTPGFSVPLSISFLKANPSLVLDTRLFDRSFGEQLLASYGDVNEQAVGLLVHSDNFQALRLLETRFRDSIDCVYIDPPYNTGKD